jgi:2-hydroxycyclohexanecarboxyl-CoA dehydrogenase
MRELSRIASASGRGFHRDFDRGFDQDVDQAFSQHSTIPGPRPDRTRDLTGIVGRMGPGEPTRREIDMPEQSGLRGLRDRVILITGAASGIGRATALRLGEEGACVGILDLDGDGAEAVANEIRKTAVATGLDSAARAFARRADITDARAVDDAIDEFESACGPVEGLVNNAGWDVSMPFLETDAAFWKKVIDINLYGPLNVTKRVLSGMVERGSGRIVSIASDAGRVGSSGEAVYAACKGGIVAFSKSVAREVARQGITLNCVAPGPTDTPLFAAVDPSGKLQPALARAIPMKRLAQPSDYPGLIAFLLSDDAAFITGQTVSVSGGLTMHG